MAGDLPKFSSLEEEVRWLRGLISVQRMADEILEDCLERQLGLAAGLDVFLSQTARMIHARGAFVQIKGSAEPVLTRVFGNEMIDISTAGQWEGALVLDARRTLFVKKLTLGTLDLGSLGYVLPGTFEEGGKKVMPLVDAIGEM